MATKSKRPSGTKAKAPKIVCQNRNCSKMGKYQNDGDFYKSRNASIGHHPFCKECVNNSINIEDMQTVYDVLKILDTPFVPEIWAKTLDDELPNYIGTYLKLINFTYKRRYEESRWRDSIFKTETSNENDADEVGVIEFPEEESDIAVWNDEWQGRYTARELKYLNNYYTNLQSDFKIVTYNHKDYARKIAQASLAMNDAYNIMKDHPDDKDAINTYKAASSNFDMLCKSAQFAESQRGANDVSLGCFGRVFDAVEKHNWVPQHIPEDKDLFDKIIDQFSNIRKSL